MSTRKKELTAVDIAKDVISLVKAKKVVVSTGLYFEPLGALASMRGSQRSLKNVLTGKGQNSCQVCAMGAMLCAFVAKKNELKVGDIQSDQTIIDKLSPYFSQAQLRLIETAFEGYATSNPGYDSYGTGTQHHQAALQFWGEYSDPTKRLIAIMKNIIENGGKFNPPLHLEPIA
jgi:hypothetical protein